MKVINKLSILRILLVFLGLSTFITNAQQDSQYTQYMYNTQTVNPGYAGNRGVLSFTGLYRTQWVGLEGAPKTMSFIGSAPVCDRLGIGLSFFKDEIGISIQNNLNLDVSYTLPLNDNSYLSFGVKGGLNILEVDYTKLNPNDLTDSSFHGSNNIDGESSPIVGAGLYLRHLDRWYLGISIPNFLQTKHYEDSTISIAKEQMTYYFIGGYVFDLDPILKFKPAFLLKATRGAPLAADISANFLFKETFTFGLAYRWDAAISGLLGFQLNENIMLGYAYDYDTTDLGNYNRGSHEFFLRFEIGSRNTNGIISPRFF